MLNICSLYAEYMLYPTSTYPIYNKTLRIFLFPRPHKATRSLLRLHVLAPLHHPAHLMPHIIAQPPLNRLVVLPCFSHCLVIFGLPCRPALRIMQNLFACRYQRTKLLHMRQTCFLFLGLLAQLRLLAHRRPFSVSGDMPCIVPAINTSLQIIHDTCPLRLHSFAILYIFFSKFRAKIVKFFDICKFFPFFLHISIFFSNFAAESCKVMNEEQRLIEAINRSMRETEVRLRAMGRKPYYVTREQAEKQVAMLLKAKEEFFAKQK